MPSFPSFLHPLQQWKQRIALEGVAPGNMRLIIGYLVGEETPGRMCNASAANCASLFPSVHPAMMAFDTNEPVIHKAAAFPRCVLLPDTNVCVNGAYRESPAPSMPAIWRPSDVQAAPRVPRSAVPLVPPPVPRHITNVMPQAVAPAPPMSAWEEMRELLYIHSPDDTPLSYAHSMGFMNDRLGQFMPTGINGTNMQILHVDTANALATTLLPSHMQSLICFVLEGTLEVNMLGIPVFTINMHSQFAVRAGQTCHVRNLGGIRASLYVISVSVALQ